MRVTLVVVLAACLLAAGEPQEEASVWFAGSLVDLELEQPLPQRERVAAWSTTWRERLHPYAVLDGPGEAWVARRGALLDRSPDAEALALHLPEARDVSGRIYLEATGEDGQPCLVPVAFRVSAGSFSAEAREQALLVARSEAQALQRGGWPGAAWWRHRVEVLSAELGPSHAMPGGTVRDVAVRANMDDTFDLFSGGRAVAENLQLDRVLPATPTLEADETVEVDGIPGITVAAYDWSDALAGARPATDALAALVPADQHAVFFPSFDAMVAVADHADSLGSDALAVLGQASGDVSDEAGTRARLQRQLGLPLSEIARLLGPAVIASVAITGGDPYLRTGSDVAVLFEARDPEVLLPLVRARVEAAVAGAAGLQTGTLEVDGVTSVAHRTPDREVSSYVARLGGAVVVTNSEVQLRRLAATAAGEVPSLASLDEYAFFRARYPLGAAGESALVVLSDATIRRWCGARCRIGNSRRTRAEAALSELQARLLDARAEGRPDASALADPPAGLGTLTIDGDDVRSSVYGTLAFLTPIAELDLDRVSQAEADLYGRWRNGYQSNWSGVFDPIALSVGVGPERVAADLTVRPLIVSSDYREIIDVAGASVLEPRAGDPHEGTLAHWVVAIDKQSAPVRDVASFFRVGHASPLDPLGWLGSSVAVYVDADPFWEELAAAEDPDEYLSDHWTTLPLGLHVAVADALQLTAFLVALRGLADTSAPDMTRWSNERYREEPYVVVRPSERAVEDIGEESARGATLYYAASGEGLIVTLNRGVLERALDRCLARRAARQAAKEAEEAEEPGDAPAPSAAASAVPSAAPSEAPSEAPAWLGNHLAVSVDGRFLGSLQQLLSGSLVDVALRQASFANLPVLNEWHRRFPGEDPVAVHERLWHRRLVCPGGGAYVWDEQAGTMASTVYGHPAAPRAGPLLPAILGRVLRASAGLTFEQDGLRARGELTLSPR